MSNTDFIIFKQHKFLRNIFSDQELAASDSIKDLKNFHAMFCQFLKIATLLPNVLNTVCGSCFQNVDSCFGDEDFSAFYRQTCADCENFEELKEVVASVEVKHNTRIKIPKFKLQIYVFVYQRLMGFPTASRRFAEFERLTTLDLYK